jgi:methylthioribulose-1-phosphate dehydratase
MISFYVPFVPFCGIFCCMTESDAEIGAALARAAQGFHARGWLLGTSGNLSAVIQHEPLRLAMSPSGVDKGELTADQLLTIDEQARVVSSHSGKPSDETLLHLQIVKDRGAGAVLHTHSIWNTILSDLYANEGGVTIAGYEMLKGLQGVRTHEHAEWLPIIENSQDMPALAESVSQVLHQNPTAHGFLLRRHGLYSWGETLAQARRHIEILEFLLETMGRTLHLKAKHNGI